MSTDDDRAAITKNFARWAATRAIQQRIGGLSNPCVFSAWEATDLSRRLENAASKAWSSARYDRQHQEWCENLRDAIRAQLKKIERSNISFGLAAKFINVYTKVAYVLPHLVAHRSFISVVHPPIDSAMIKLIKDKGVGGAPKSPWTKFAADDYRKALSALRAVNRSDLNLWRLERDWTGV